MKTCDVDGGLDNLRRLATGRATELVSFQNERFTHWFIDLGERSLQVLFSLVR